MYVKKEFKKVIAFTKTTGKVPRNKFNHGGAISV